MRPHCKQLGDPRGGGGCHFSIRTQAWEGRAEAALGIISLPAYVWGEVCKQWGLSPPSSMAPLCPATIFPSFISSTSFSLSCLHSPNTHRLLSWVLSHPTHSLPLVSAPSQPQGPPHGAPCRPRLMGARWPPSDSATGLWEPRRPAFPCPHTQLTLPR